MQPKPEVNKQIDLQIVKDNTEPVCYRCGSSEYHKRGLTKAGKQRYFCLDCRRYFADDVDYTNCKPNYLKLGDDVWDASVLGVKTRIYSQETKLVFLYFKQNWLKDTVKKFIRYKASNTSFRQLQKYIQKLGEFSKFLEIYYPLITFESLTRKVMIDFIDFLNQKKLNNETKNQYLGTINIFFETGKMNSWFDVPAYLIKPEDYGKLTKHLPRYIPEEVMQQLNQHLEALPESVMRMVLVLQETGLRIGELLQLPMNCLKFDAKGGAYIQYMNWKMSKEDTKPISMELAKTIKEQENYIRQHLEQDFEYLFCARKTGKYRDRNTFYPKAKVMDDKAFIKFLKQLTEDFDIKDNSGKRWNFESHQFRHTVGTRMVNLGVPFHIIQRYLGHESPQMTMTYAHIHDETLRKEVEKYHESRVVNFQGETSELDETILSSNDDLEWFKKNVQARALEHGYCARPKVLGDCDIPGFDGCYNCPHWRTNKNFIPILKDTLERTNNVLEKAQNCGWQLQVHKNTPIKENLEKVIKILEADND
ncbi:MAG: tyrosine-type recombinase/integrase [Nostoc sp.]|uniref:tyrosine-type recombinase/integrase n=1 Tax=Nostoc sp. TaxID=1180 RepID=UPI002FF8DCCB